MKDVAFCYVMAVLCLIAAFVFESSEMSQTGIIFAVAAGIHSRLNRLTPERK